MFYLQGKTLPEKQAKTTEKTLKELLGNPEKSRAAKSGFEGILPVMLT